MILLLQAKNTPPLIIKPKLIIVAHMDDFGWQGKMLFKTSSGLSANKMIRQSRSCIAPQTVFQLTWCFRKTFITTLIFGSAWAIEMTAGREEWFKFHMSATTATHTRSGTLVIKRSSVPPLAWVEPTTNWSQHDYSFMMKEHNSGLLLLSWKFIYMIDHSLKLVVVFCEILPNKLTCFEDTIISKMQWKYINKDEIVLL